MAGLVYILNCGVNPISSMTVNGLPVTLAAGGLPPWPAGLSADPSVLTPVTIPLNPKGSGTPSTAALVAGNASNSISLGSNQVNYNRMLDLSSYFWGTGDNMAMFVFFGTGAAFGQQRGGSMCQIVLTDQFGTFVQSYFFPGGVLRR